MFDIVFMVVRIMEDKATLNLWFDDKGSQPQEYKYTKAEGL